jgi:hypothetical protein
VRESDRVQTATQTLHRLTSYTPGHSWDQPADDPRVVQRCQLRVCAQPRSGHLDADLRSFALARLRQAVLDGGRQCRPQ